MLNHNPMNQFSLSYFPGYLHLLPLRLDPCEIRQHLLSQLGPRYWLHALVRLNALDPGIRNLLHRKSERSANQRGKKICDKIRTFELSISMMQAR